MAVRANFCLLFKSPNARLHVREIGESFDFSVKQSAGGTAALLCELVNGLPLILVAGQLPSLSRSLHSLSTLPTPFSVPIYQINHADNLTKPAVGKRNTYLTAIVFY